MPLNVGVSDVIEILGVRDAGINDRERIILRCRSSVDIGKYLILQGTDLGESGISPRTGHVFWLPDEQVGAGEYVRIYTKAGSNNRTTGTYEKSPAVFHNFYWSKSSAIWAQDKISIILISVADWAHFRVS